MCDWISSLNNVHHKPAACYVDVKNLMLWHVVLNPRQYRWLTFKPRAYQNSNILHVIRAWQYFSCTSSSHTIKFKLTFVYHRKKKKSQKLAKFGFTNSHNSNIRACWTSRQINIMLPTMEKVCFISIYVNFSLTYFSFYFFTVKP